MSKCAECLHQPVCKLEPDYQILEAKLEPLAEAFVTINLLCKHYIRGKQAKDAEKPDFYWKNESPY